MMIRFKLSLLLFLITFTIVAQEADEKEVDNQERIVFIDDFINIKIYSGIEVKLIPSDENKLVISGEDKMDVVPKIKRNTLKIRHSLEHILNPTFTYVELHHSSVLDEISLYQGSNLTSDDTYAQTSISLRVNEGSTMNLSFEGEKITSVVSTGSQLFLSGKVTNHQSVVNSGGACEAETLISEQTKVSVTAGGMSYVNAKELIEAKVTAGGIIRVYGNPKKMTTKKTIGGQIFEMK
ncbi:MAG: hypothetical protein CND43_01775 [Flavobacteriales bacterium MED-G15]|nr:MAG: hypothetical protein CND43_01775 [Flavobacteriales bacterium MED-G15]|tara:strand:- start:29 stop:739 length:711 start_codon:yes stop_codon:yes gene_type:complete